MTPAERVFNFEEQCQLDAVNSFWTALEVRPFYQIYDWGNEEILDINESISHNRGGFVTPEEADFYTSAELIIDHRNGCKYQWIVRTMFERGTSLGKFYEQGGAWAHFAVTTPQDWIPLWTISSAEWPKQPVNASEFGRLEEVMKDVVHHCLDNIELIIGNDLFDEVKLLAEKPLYNADAPKSLGDIQRLMELEAP